MDLYEGEVGSLYFFSCHYLTRVNEINIEILLETRDLEIHVLVGNGSLEYELV